MRPSAGALRVVLLALLLTGCGVRAQDAPEAVPDVQRPSFATGVEVVEEPAEAVVYLVDGGTLVRRRLPAASSGPEDALRALLTLAGPVERLRSAVPAGTRLRSVGRDGDLVRIELDDRFVEVRGSDQLLAAAQIVFTATEQPPARRVQITVGGQPVALPTQDGTSAGDPVTRDAYSTLSPR